ncbi:hypothetical protein cypCar_00009425 [Cyprinus carpio]|nr:hypothetical protein cypCar_00009425 [Cyprinus carpio]
MYALSGAKYGKMPGLVSCLGDLIVTGIIILFSDHVQSEIWTNEEQLTCLLLSVSDVQFGRLGSRVVLTCGGAHDGSPVAWQFNGSSVPAGQTHKSSLTLLNTTHSMEGNYSCHDERGTLLQSIKLRLGRNVKDRDVEPCEQEHIGVNECTITDPPFWTSKFLVNITELNPLGSNSTILQIDAHELLKPDPPEDVRVLQVEGQSTQLLVQWSLPSSWPVERMDAFPLTYLLRYRPIGSNYWSRLETEENTSLKIMDALVGQPAYRSDQSFRTALIMHITVEFIVTPDWKPGTVDFVGSVCSGHGGSVINHHCTSMGQTEKTGQCEERRIGFHGEDEVHTDLKFEKMAVFSSALIGHQYRESPPLTDSITHNPPLLSASQRMGSEWREL